MSDGKEFVSMVAGLLALGGLLVLAGIALNVAIGLGQKLYRWVLDLPDPQRKISWMAGKLVNLCGYKRDEHHSWLWTNAKGRQRNPADLIVLCMLVAIFTPLAVFLAVKFYPVVLAALLAFGLAHLARFSIRLSRVLKKHIADPNAHKGGRND